MTEGAAEEVGWLGAAPLGTEWAWSNFSWRTASRVSSGGRNFFNSFRMEFPVGDVKDALLIVEAKNSYIEMDILTDVDGGIPGEPNLPFHSLSPPEVHNLQYSPEGCQEESAILLGIIEVGTKEEPLDLVETTEGFGHIDYQRSLQDSL